ncbi:HK97 family phage prohead protease [Enterococcus sp. BWR-S5]|nr:HK97 family phage prohead protease [Enterococcus sp. BWR-S5]
MKQYRSISTDIQTRSEETSEEKRIAAYFAIFNKETELWPGAFEEVAPTAFGNIGDVRGLFNHDTGKVLGRTKSNTLTLQVDEKGLYGEIIVNENDSEAVNLYERVKRGDIDQCSFGFEIVKEHEEWREDGSVKWTIEEVELFEVSIVAFPAYQDTIAEARQQQFKKISESRMAAKKQQLKERIKNGIKKISYREKT